jgi:hypothetical protein
VYYRQHNKAWITTGIKISNQHKRVLCLLCRDTNNSKLKKHYKKYCRILSDVIKTAKKLHYNKLIADSNNKAKTIWNIVQMETNKKSNDNGLLLNIDGKIYKGHKALPIFLILTLLI